MKARKTLPIACLAGLLSMTAAPGVSLGQTAERSAMKQSEAAPTSLLATDAEHAWDDHWMDEGSNCDRCGLYVPNMLGDFIGGFFFGPAPSGAPEQALAIARTLPRFKVADNNSVRPRTRFLYSYNNFHNAFETSGDVHRNFFGGEFAFWPARMSLEMRISANHFNDFPIEDSDRELGNLITTLKGVLYNTENSTVSAGLAVGWPTSDYPGALSQSNYIVAPWAGALYAPTDANWYVQGFEQLDIPSETDDVFLLHTSIGAGYFLRRQDTSRIINSIVPTAEFHVYTPIDDASGIYEDLGYDHVFNVTLGTNLVFRSIVLASGISFPIGDNHHYDVEFQLHFNWRIGPAR